MMRKPVTVLFLCLLVGITTGQEPHSHKSQKEASTVQPFPAPTSSHENSGTFTVTKETEITPTNLSTKEKPADNRRTTLKKSEKHTRLVSDDRTDRKGTKLVATTSATTRKHNVSSQTTHARPETPATPLPQQPTDINDNEMTTTATTPTTKSSKQPIPTLTSPTPNQPINESKEMLPINVTSQTLISASQQLCPCQCSFQLLDHHISNQSVTELCLGIHRDLKINRTDLSSNRNRKISVPDSRRSSQAIGVFAIAMCLIPFMMIIILDLNHLRIVFRKFQSGI